MGRGAARETDENFINVANEQSAVKSGDDERRSRTVGIQPDRVWACRLILVEIFEEESVEAGDVQGVASGREVVEELGVANNECKDL